MEPPTIETYQYGHLVYWQGDEWRYADTDEPVSIRRPCPQCHQLPTRDGYDACLGHIPGAISACCGHGRERGHILWEEETLDKESILNAIDVLLTMLRDLDE